MKNSIKTTSSLLFPITPNPQTTIIIQNKCKPKHLKQVFTPKTIFILKTNPKKFYWIQSSIQIISKSPIILITKQTILLINFLLISILITNPM